MMKLYFLFALFFLSALLWTGCGSVVEIEPTVRYVRAFDTSVQISVYDTTVSPSKILSALKAFEAKLVMLDKNMNSNKTGEILFELNNSGKKVWDLPQDLRSILIPAIEWGEKTDGLFDITIKPVTDLYRWGDDFSPPDSNLIKKALRKINYRKLKWQGKKLFRGEKQIDLDYIAKGYALNEASEILLERNIRNYLVNASGVIQFHWTHPDVPATIYIRHPRKAGKYFGQFRLNHSCGLATAADYQKYEIVKGKRYHNLISPKTGKPAENCVAITVKASNAFVANFYANYLFLLGHEKARNIVIDNHVIEAIIIWEDDGMLKHWESAGFAEIFELNEK